MDKRRFHRWNADIPCHWEWEFGSAAGKVSNLSVGGARVRAQWEIPVEGADISFHFEKPGQECTLQAHVVYADPSGSAGGCFGIEFYTRDVETSRKLVYIFQSGALS